MNAIKGKDKTKLIIATLNTRTLRTDHKLAELENALEKINWDILGLSEIRRLGEEVREYKDYIFYYKGETKGLHGVGFMVKKELKESIIQFRSKSERIAVLDLALQEGKDPWSIIQVYAPTEQAKEEDKDLFYASLLDTIEESNKNKIVMGDFNSQIGCQQEGEKNVIGLYSQGKRNKNGQKLIDLALESNLRIMNTYYKKKINRKWTWISPDGKHKNEIDFILTNKPNLFNDVSIINQLNFSTNHRMVRATLKITNKRKTRKHIKNISDQIPIPIPENIRNKAKEQLDNLKSNYSIQEKYNELEKILTKLRIELTHNMKRTNKDRIGHNARILINERTKLLTDRKKNIKKIEEISKKITSSIRHHKKKDTSQQNSF